MSLINYDIANVPVYNTISDLQALELYQVNIGSIVYCNDPENPGQYISQNVLPTENNIYFESDTGEFYWVLLHNNLFGIEDGIIQENNLPKDFNFDLAAGYGVVGNSSNKAIQFPCNAMIFVLSSYSSSMGGGSYTIPIPGLLSSDIALVWPTTAQATANGQWIGNCSVNSLNFITYNTSGIQTSPGGIFSANILIFRNTV